MVLSLLAVYLIYCGADREPQLLPCSASWVSFLRPMANLEKYQNSKCEVWFQVHVHHFGTIITSKSVIQTIISKGFCVLVIWVLSCSVVSDSLWPPWTVACQASLSMGFSRQEYWSGLPFPSLGDLPHPGIKPTSPESPALAGEFFTTKSTGKPSELSIAA